MNSFKDYPQYYCAVWQYGLLSFQAGYTKFERFLPKNQHTQRKLLNFENWCIDELSKIIEVPKKVFAVFDNVFPYYLIRGLQKCTRNLILGQG